MFISSGKERILKPIDVARMTGKFYAPIDHDLKVEKEILDNLVAAWNAFVKLPATHPMELGDFCDGIHKCQYVLMAREARRSRPDIYPVKKENVE
ncbi:hypothetical protein K413DRAFT_4788 [Clostridium sp. ASBs410]|nr:hypothetical protein K413DRAFT_4788 [Clostridium sp. ASBs410]